MKTKDQSTLITHCVPARGATQLALAGLLAFAVAACGASPVQSGGTVAAPEVQDGNTEDVTLHSSDEQRDYFAARQDEGLELSGALLTPMPVAVTSFGAVAQGDSVYLYGGYAGEPHVYHRHAQARTLWRLDLGETPGEWTALASDEQGVQGVRLFAWGSRVCRAGGTRIQNDRGEDVSMVSLGAVDCFDEGARAWEHVLDLPAPRSSFDAAVVDGSLCIAGGWALDGAPRAGRWLESTACLELTEGGPEAFVAAGEPADWREFDQGFRRRAVAIAGQGQGDSASLVMVGGLDEEGEISAEVRILNLADGTWSAGPEFPELAFGVAATTGSDGQIIASGMSGVVYRLSEDLSEWTPLTTLVHKRFFHELVPSSRGIVALGGVGGMHDNGRVRVVERVLTFDQRDSAFDVWRLHWPSDSRNRQGIWAHGEHLYFFGGNNSLGQHDFEADNFVNEGLRVHLPSLSIDPAPNYPAARQTMATLAEEDSALFVGGFGHDGEEAVSFSDSQRFDGEGFTSGPALPRGRTQFGIAAHDGHRYIFGGLNYDPRRATETDQMAAFEHETSILVQRPGEENFSVHEELTLPGPRRAFAGTYHDGHYYLVGGMREGFTLVEDCLDFDFESGEFSPLACPEPRLSGDLVVVSGKLVLFGGSVRGEEGLDESRSVEVFDPAQPELGWRTLAEVPFSTRHARAFAVDHRLVVVSTHTEDPILMVAFLDVDGAISRLRDESEGGSEGASQ